MDPEALAVARDRLRPVESVQEDQVQPEEHIYAEVHQEDPDAIEVFSEEPEVALEATPDVVSQAGDRVAAPLEIVLPPPKPRRLGWINRGPRRFRLCTVPEENIVPDSVSTEV
jgi:hypothetical protein